MDAPGRLYRARAAARFDKRRGPIARKDLADKERQEIELLQAYLPAQLPDAELDALIREAIAATGAASIKDMGKVMGVVKSKAAGRVDMAAVGARVRAALGG